MTNTPTIPAESDDLELRLQIVRNCYPDPIPSEVSQYGSIEATYEVYAESPLVKQFAKFITKEKERAALEARIDELEQVYPQLQKHHGLSGEGDYYYDDRIEVLEAKRKELS